MGGERFILAVKLENGYKPQQSVCVLGPREANCLFVLCVYGLSAAQLTGNLNLKEAEHQSPFSAFCAHTPDRARQGAAPHPTHGGASQAMPSSGVHRDVGKGGKDEHGLLSTEFTSFLSPLPQQGCGCWLHKKKR